MHSPDRTGIIGAGFDIPRRAPLAAMLLRERPVIDLPAKLFPIIDLPPAKLFPIMDLPPTKLLPIASPAKLLPIKLLPARLGSFGGLMALELSWLLLWRERVLHMRVSSL